ncbi:flagellar biosynthetic protein FliQ [Thermovibrio guaymasensis]|uniref:Flagellar biosynthetic protein FliQ n=1 Tax=Thermovibrio guaymasensis TaxID=240167 RepID=A0A420W7H8_9BACT|nr:flagellar biosynthesis protein FliQ [Thermovibrio guaymasensis]RKQ63259.1 flagellar biosynthetic protein FliQ [Thermovibrio guaymasensis]
MTVDQVISLGQKMFEVAFLVGTPVLLTTFLVGLVVSIFQAATQIHEMTLTFIPKILVTMVTLYVLGNWILIKLVDYTKENFLYLLQILK